MAEEDDWDTGAEQTEGTQDRFNKFDPNRVNADVQDTPPEIVRSEPKPEYSSAPDFSSVALSSPPEPPQPSRPVDAPMAPSLPTPAPAPAPKPSQGGSGGNAFTAKLSKQALDYFNELSRKPFSAQAVAFLNAYWQEVGVRVVGCWCFDVAELTSGLAQRAKPISYSVWHGKRSSMPTCMPRESSTSISTMKEVTLISTLGFTFTKSSATLSWRSRPGKCGETTRTLHLQCRP